MNSRLAFVVAHFHEQGKVPRDLFNLVRHLRELTPRVVFVSTGISSTERARLAPFASVIARPNVGYDFWSYKVGIDALGDRSELDRLVLLNSSFVTLDPQRLCAAFLTPVAGPALRGITCCAERGWHAQSYWVSFETADLINSAAFAGWWSTLAPISERSEVITHQEIGMSLWFAARGIAVTAAFEPSQEDTLVAVCRNVGARQHQIEIPPDAGDRIVVDLTRARQVNQTLYLWDSLVTQFHILKIELLKSNPTRQFLAHFLDALARNRPELLELIRDAVPSVRSGS